MARGRGAAVDELEALDPITGRSIAGPGDEDTPPPPARSLRVQRRRRLALVLAALSVVAGAMAAYDAVQIASLRSLERTWRTALAVDDERAQLDRRILDGLDAMGNREDPSGRGPIGTIGDDAEARLAGLQHRLEGRSVIDGRLDALRRQMVEALQFRRYQMTPNRLRIGDSPLRKTDLALAVQLRRWRVGARPLDRPPPALRTAPLADRLLSTYADADSDVLVGRRDHELVVYDLGASRSAVRAFDQPVTHAFAIGGVAVVVSGGMATAFRLPTLEGPPVWQAEATAAYPDAGADVVTVEHAGAVTSLTPATGVGLHGPAPLPPGARVVGATHGRLVLLDSPDGSSRGRLSVWDPQSAVTERVLTGDGRLVAAGESEAAWQGTAGGGDDALWVADLLDRRPLLDILLPRTDAGAGVFSAGGDTLAFTAGPLAGDRAAVLVYQFDGGGALRGLGDPATTIDGGLAWSRDGARAYWTTREGRIVYTDATNGDRPRVVRIGPAAPALLSLSAR